jgi:DNA modification methylase
VKNKLREIKKEEPTWDEIIDFCEKNSIPVMDGTSIFDPVVCELAYRWFCLPGGKILDPFAGGSVRGIVATKLDMDYYGVDLRKEQVEANWKNYEQICKSVTVNNTPSWLVGDSTNIDEIIPGLEADFVLSCPPYVDLERYSDDPRDLSTMEYEKFIQIYRDIIKKSCSMLKPDRFACFVIGEVRSGDGSYYNFVGDTINAFTDAGLHYYNEMILVNQVGSLAMRAGKQFNVSRKVGKQHQNVLVFYKGDMKKIKSNFPELDFSDINVFEEN